MIDLSQKGLPDTVTIWGEPFQVRTDYRVWMRFCLEFEARDRKQDFDIAYLFRSEIPAIQTQEDLNAVLMFAYPPFVVPNTGGEKENDKILDYLMDGDYIYAAFLGQYSIDLVETKLHWHKFRALVNGLNDTTRLYEIMGYRCYTGNDKEMVKLRESWKLPVSLTEEEQHKKKEFDDYFG